MNLLEHIGKRLCRLRINRGYPVDFAAELVGITKTEMHLIESGCIIPSYITYDWLCAIYGTTIKKFMSIYKWTYTAPKQIEIGDKYCA